jgi:hypothetical protein
MVAEGEIVGGVPITVTTLVRIEVGELPAELLPVAVALQLSPPTKPDLVAAFCEASTMTELLPLKEQLKATATFSVFVGIVAQVTVAELTPPVIANPPGESVGAGKLGKDVSTTISKYGR